MGVRACVTKKFVATGFIEHTHSNAKEPMML